MVEKFSLVAICTLCTLDCLFPTNFFIFVNVLILIMIRSAIGKSHRIKLIKREPRLFICDNQKNFNLVKSEESRKLILTRLSGALGFH